MMMSYKYFSEPLEIKFPIQCMVIENKAVLRNTILSLEHGNENDLFVLSENYVPLSFKKAAYFMMDTVGSFQADKKAATRLEEELTASAHNNFPEQVFAVQKALTELAEKLSFDFEFDLSFNDEKDTASIIKFLSFKPRTEGDTHIEHLASFMIFLNKYIGYHVFFTIGLFLLYDNEEISELEEILTAHQINIVDIEPTVPDIEAKKLAILDKDLCQVVDNY